MPESKDGKVCKENLFVFTANKDGENFKARDGEIAFWEYDEATRKFSIEFNNRPGFPYRFSRERVALYRIQERYDAKRNIALVDGRREKFEHAFLMLPDIETAPEIIRIVRENETFHDYDKKKAAIVEKAAASGLFCYLSAIEHEKARDGDAIEKYLAKRYDLLGDRLLSDRAASAFLDPKEAGLEEPDTETVIYPFGCNLSQMRAVENALSSKLSLIEGPPGTGKTQTILNVIANLLIRGEDVLVASPNNSATDNVVEKLHREGLGFLVARLGNTENQEAFVANQPSYPADLAKWCLEEESLARLNKSITEAVPKLRKTFEVKRQLAKDQEELRQWELQQSYFLQHFGEVEPLLCRSGIYTPHLHELREKLTELADSDHGLGLLPKLVSRFAHGIGRWSDFSASPVEMELRISQTIFKKEIERLKAAIAQAENKLAGCDADKLMEDVTCWSRMVLLSRLGERYGMRACVGGARPEFEKRALYDAAIRKEYRIVTSTVNAAIGQCGAMDTPFDYVIIDEASQCSLTTGLLALASGKRAVVVGDAKQLPCVISERDRMIGDDKFDKRLDERYRYGSESLLSCLEKCSSVATEEAIPVQLLAEHYRCHPAIIRYCNQRFYGGELVVMRDERGLPASDALTLVEAEGHDSIRDFNRVQAGIAIDRGVAPLLASGIAHDKIGIVTPYRKQANGMAGNPQLAGIEVDTVHKYQGREKDAMVFVTKVSHTTRFVDNPNLVNVSVSRAKERLVLVAAPGLLEGDGNIAELARYIRYQGGKCIQADEPTMFDLLYPSQRGPTAEERAGDVSGGESYADGDTPSEVIVEKRLHLLLGEFGANGQIGFVRNYPLKMFLPRSLDLNPEEAEFVGARAHADFLFYRIIDKCPLAVLEVDGQYHDTPVQKRRDKLKDEIMGKASLPLRRLRTNSYKPDEFLEGMVRYIRALADSNNSATCHPVSDVKEE